MTHAFRSARGFARAVAILALAFGCLAEPAAAQTPRGDSDGLGSLQQLRQRFSQPTGSLVLEGVLDPDEYIVGPGDEFSISIGGTIPIQYSENVGADGTLIIPNLGSIQVGGSTLRQAQDQVRRAAQNLFRNVSVGVNLSAPRRFFVHVTGAVPQPGRYQAIPVARVSDVLDQSYAANQMVPVGGVEGEHQFVPLPSVGSERPPLGEGYRPSFRSVTVTSRDGSRRVVDIYRYLTTGDTNHNPYVQDGDVVTVSAYHAARETVRISGEVAFPGYFPFREGDTAMELLTLALAASEFERLASVRLTRRGEDGRAETRIIDVAAMRRGDAPNVELQRGDHLNIQPTEVSEARIYGAVEFPGIYPIRAGETTLRDIVEFAGGLRADANLSAAFITRAESAIFRPNPRASDLDFFSRLRLAQSMGEERLLIDVAVALESGQSDYVMKSGDRVVIPFDDQTVFVTGNVLRPGYVPYVEGLVAADYIALAGGTGADSRGVYVFEQNTGESWTGMRSTVPNGATIFVDRRPVADSPELAQLILSDQVSRRQTRIMTTQTIITGVTALATVLTTYVAVFR